MRFVGAALVLLSTAGVAPAAEPPVEHTTAWYVERALEIDPRIAQSEAAVANLVQQAVETGKSSQLSSPSSPTTDPSRLLDIVV